MDTRNEKQKWRLFDCKTQERQEERVHTAFPPELASGNTAGVKKPGTSNRLGSRANEQELGREEAMTAPPNGHTIYFHPRFIISQRDIKKIKRRKSDACFIIYYFINYAILNFNEKWSTRKIKKAISQKFFRSSGNLLII